MYSSPLFQTKSPILTFALSRKNNDFNTINGQK